MTPDIVEFVEKQFGVRLLEPQKEFLRKVYNAKQVYFIMPRRAGYDGFTHLSLIARAMLNDVRKE